MTSPFLRNPPPPSYITKSISLDFERKTTENVQIIVPFFTPPPR